MRSCNFMKFRMVIMLGSLMAAMFGGCAPSGSRLVYPDVDVKVIVRDAVTGEEINGCLLVVRRKSSDWILERIGPVHGADRPTSIVDSATIERVDSGHRLRQKAVYDRFIPWGFSRGRRNMLLGD